MKTTTRILCAVLAVMLLLTGCSMPKIVLPGTPDVAATYGDGKTISTGEYLAFLYMNFTDVYQQYSYYAQYGMDPWEQTIPYDNADGETVKLSLEDYIVAITQDAIKRNIIVEQMIAENKLSLLEDEAKEIHADLAEMQENAYLPLGFNNEHFSSVYTDMMLNQRSTFFGLYGEGGPKAVSAADVRKYFDDNYLSYKIISVPLTKTDSDSKTVALTDDEKAAKLKKLNEYLTVCNDKGFEAAMDAYNKDNAKEGDTVEVTKDEDNRIDDDATAMDEKLAKAVRSVEVGKAKIVEYGGDDENPNTTAALIMRLDINNPGELFDDSKESILISMKSEEFEKAVKDAAAKLDIEFNKKVLKKCSPKDFAE